MFALCMYAFTVLSDDTCTMLQGLGVSLPQKCESIDKLEILFRGVVMSNSCSDVGDLATMFVLEDRVTARTNSGDNEPEGDPNNIPDAEAVAASIVGNFTPSEWGQNITDQILELKVSTPMQLNYHCIEH